MHVSFHESGNVEMCRNKLYILHLVKFKLEYHTEDLLSRYYTTGKTGMLLHSWCFQMQGCVLLCDVSLLPVSFELLQLFLINKQEQLPPSLS